MLTAASIFPDRYSRSGCSRKHRRATLLNILQALQHDRALLMQEKQKAVSVRALPTADLISMHIFCGVFQGTRANMSCIIRCPCDMH
jgi:hypothetical protein